jgi:hypothetical protein
MKKTRPSVEYIRIQRLKKHLKNSISNSVRLKRLRTSSIKRKIKKQGQFEPITLESTIFTKHFVRKNPVTKAAAFNLPLKVPADFCILSNPDACLNWLNQFIVRLTNSSSTNFSLNHKKEKKWSLGSEVLLGLVAEELTESRKSEGLETVIHGTFSDNFEHQQLLHQVGLISELDKSKPVKADKIHVFKQNCKLNESSSSTADDLKTETATEFVNHIKSALHDHNLKLDEEAAKYIKGCLGEILDNAAEHSGLTAPTWYVRGYIDNNVLTKSLQLMVMNIGNSVSDTFLNLPPDNPSLCLAMEYARHHKLSGFSLEELITIAALQGKMSSKNDTESGTRGQGTVTLIETFETLYEDYALLRRPNSKEPAIMNLISGSVVVKFDGSCKSTKTEDEDGGERVKISFNSSGKLSDPPLSKYITRLKKSYFPGLMINIKIPLLGSVEPIGD